MFPVCETGTGTQYLQNGGIMIRAYLLKQADSLVVYLQRRAELQHDEKTLSDQALKITTLRLNEAFVILTGVINTLTT